LPESGENPGVNALDFSAWSERRGAGFVQFAAERQ
jgi:hypothetical protein